MPLIKRIDFCDGCGITANEPNVHIQQCSKCRVAQYCSRRCQTKSWKSFHKHECRKPEDAEAAMTSRRAVARFQGSMLSQLSSAGAANTQADANVYYLKIHRPWIHDICLSGPYHVVQGTYSNLALNFRFSRAGMVYLEEMVRENVMEHIAHIQAPLDADVDKVITAEIIVKQDAELHAALPCPVYNVVWSEPLQPAGAQTDALGNIPVNDMDILGTYLSRDKAARALKVEMEDRADRVRGGKAVQTEVGGMPSAAIIKDGVILETFLVSYDSGLMGPTEFIPQSNLD